MTNGANQPSWTRYIPDARIWIVAGLFALAWRLLYMIEERPDLLNSAPFMSIAVLILGTGGLGTIVAFYYGGTKVGGEVMKANADAVIAGTPPPAPGTTTTTHTPGGVGETADPIPVVVKSSETEPVVVKEAGQP